MRRRLVNFAAALSLVLGTATVGLWVRSYWRADLVWWYPSDQQRSILGSANGGLHFQQYVASNSLWEGLRHGHSTVLAAQAGIGPSLASWRFAGFAYYNNTTPPPGTTILRMRIVGVPYWFPVLVFAVLPAWWLWRARVRRAIAARRRGAMCRRCGYDLRATPERCPECGTAVDPIGVTS